MSNPGTSATPSLELSNPLELLKSTLATSHGKLTIADAATRTGMSIHQARETIIRLIELYEADAYIDEHGRITVHFRLPLHRRRLLLLREWWRRRLAGELKAVRRAVRRDVNNCVPLHRQRLTSSSRNPIFAASHLPVDTIPCCFTAEVTQPILRRHPSCVSA